jgi:serine protease Do
MASAIPCRLTYRRVRSRRNGWTRRTGHRTTSAIIASTLEHTKMIQTADDAQVYVLDKALNYGNSGGPIVATESGRAFAVCSRFQPVVVPQVGGGTVWVPSLYGVVTSIANTLRVT